LNRATRLNRLVAGAWQDFDLLRRRREQLGIEPLQPVAGPGLLWRGALIGTGLLAAGIGGWLGLFAYEKLLAGQEEALQPVAAAHQGYQAQLAERAQSNEQLAKANQALADAILSIPSGALLLGDLAVSTPAAVQLTLAKQEGTQLQLNGVAAEPDALRTINAFQLLLERSPLFQPQQVQLVKVTAMPQGQTQAGQPEQAAPGLFFEITAALAPAATKANLPRLEALGATGLRRRLAVIQEEGLLQ